MERVAAVDLDDHIGLPSSPTTIGAVTVARLPLIIR
jgi:hypothetical protein